MFLAYFRSKIFKDYLLEILLSFNQSCFPKFFFRKYLQKGGLG